jgi:hypothetical protein
METIVRNVSDLPAIDRSAAERLVGHELALNQQLVIFLKNQVVKNQNGSVAVSETSSAQKLPEWCNVYQGLSGKEIDELEKSILPRADLSRPHE